VTRAGYYAWRCRGESARRKQDRELLGAIRAIFSANRGTYGSPRVYRELVKSGADVSRRRVERLMREAGLEGAGGLPLIPSCAASSSGIRTGSGARVPSRRIGSGSETSPTCLWLGAGAT